MHFARRRNAMGSRWIYFSLLAPLLFVVGCSVKEEQAAYDAHVKNLIDEHQASINECYQAQLKSNEKLGEGKIRIHMDQESDGSPKDIRQVFGFQGSKPVYECMVSNIKEWKFRPTYLRGDVQITWSFSRDKQVVASPNSTENN